MIQGPLGGRGMLGGVLATHVRRQAEAAWTPASLSDVNLWLDANDLTTLFQLINGTTAVASDGDLIGYWADKSPANNDAAAAADNATRLALAANALNGKPVVRSASGDLLNNTTLSWNNDAYTIAMVYKFGSWVANSGIFIIKPASGNDFNTNAGCVISQHSSNTAQTNLTINPSSQTSLGLATNARILTVTFNGASKISAWVDGVSVLTAHTYNRPYSASNGYLINGRYLSGAVSASFRGANDYAEILNVSRVVTTAEHNQIGEYLAAKWGMSWTTVT